MTFRDVDPVGPPPEREDLDYHLTTLFPPVARAAIWSSA